MRKLTGGPARLRTRIPLNKKGGYNPTHWRTSLCQSFHIREFIVGSNSQHPVAAVHVVGGGAVTSLGLDLKTSIEALYAGTSGTQGMADWSEIDGLRCLVAAPVEGFDGRFIPRKTRRTMSKMSQMLCRAAAEALAQAGLDADELNARRVMLIAGSTTGSTESLERSFLKAHNTRSTVGQPSTTMFMSMNHSVALNLASYLGFKGRVLSPSSACSTGAEAMMLGAQMIEAGICDIAVCGGADELHVATAIAFDTVEAASQGFNDTPGQACRPFDAGRDGVVVSEGAAVAILESSASRDSRGAASLGVLRGWAQSCDGGSVAHSSTGSMAANMRVALDKAGVTASDIGYVNAHATGTTLGDAFEAQATFDVLGEVAVSSLKGHMGHSFAPCGTFEALATLHMMETGRFVPTLNLDARDPGLPPLRFLAEETRLDAGCSLSNNFAMGGMNVSLVFAKP